VLGELRVHTLAMTIRDSHWLKTQSYLIYENWLNSWPINFNSLIEYNEVIAYYLAQKE